MSAALLKEAAVRLDELADDAMRLRDAPGEKHPRWLYDGNPSGWVRPASGRGTVATASSYDVEQDGGRQARYIAAMSPTVGKALAAWLRSIAETHDETACPAVVGALAVARAVLGRAA